MDEKKRFPPEPWSVTEDNYRPEDLERNASLFFLGNGYLGIRGGFEETCGPNRGVHKGTFINGFYETSPQVYGESAYGFPDKKQAIINLPDSTEVCIYLDDELFSLEHGKILSYQRRLLLKEGLLERKIAWQSPGGRRMSLEVTRCVSMERMHSALIRVKISGLSGTEKLKIVSSCYSDVVSHKTSKSDPRTGAGFIHPPLETVEKRILNGTVLMKHKTVNSGLELGFGMAHSYGAGLIPAGEAALVNRTDFIYEGFPGTSNEEFCLEKYISCCTSIEMPAEELLLRTEEELINAVNDGADKFIAGHSGAVKRFWKAADIEIDGDDYTQQGIRFNIFSLYQSAGRDGFRNVAAKGLSGEGYEGHYFWDTEIYAIPFFTYTLPEIAEKLLLYRYNILDAARERAVVMNESGALFPWRTINGEEASAYFPAGTAQYHINADIAYGIQKYVTAAGESAFFDSCGIEILAETARLWMSLGFFEKATGTFRINVVTGPDEYTAIVNNNYFTNLMAANHLEFAAESVIKLKKRNKTAYRQLAGKIALSESEPELWQRAAAAMYLPYDENLCINPQDDTFLEKKRWDFEGTAADKYPLLLNYHPLVIYRHQVLKQPDVVLADFLLGGRTTRIRKLRNYEYYTPLTTGDSSLSPCIQSIMASELGRPESAYSYFIQTARMDLDDINSNTSDGVHIAAMGGTWLSIVYGFAGFRDHGGRLSFAPRLPECWKQLKFRLRIKDSLLSVDIGRDSAAFEIEEGGPLQISVRGADYTVSSESTATVDLRPGLKAVLFDLDGVITDTAEYHYLAWKRLADEKGYTFSREINERLRGIGRLESLDIILQASGVELSGEERAAQAAIKNEYYREFIKQITPGEILPGINDFLSELKAQGIKTALASASRNARDVIRNLGLEEDFDLVVDAAEVRRGKPDPEVFITAAERLGYEVEDCAGIEDAEAGVSALKSAGIFSLGIGPAASAADWSIETTADISLTELLKRFGRRE